MKSDALSVFKRPPGTREKLWLNSSLLVCGTASGAAANWSYHMPVGEGGQQDQHDVDEDHPCQRLINLKSTRCRLFCRIAATGTQAGERRFVRVKKLTANSPIDRSPSRIV